jgi:hypothetical protein
MLRRRYSFYSEYLSSLECARHYTRIGSQADLPDTTIKSTNTYLRRQPRTPVKYLWQYNTTTTRELAYKTEGRNDDEDKSDVHP